MPDKKWLINIIYSLEPNHTLFKKLVNSSTIQVTLNQIEILKDLDTSLGRKKNLRFFRRTKDQIEQNKSGIPDQKIYRQKPELQGKQKKHGFK